MKRWLQDDSISIRFPPMSPGLILMGSAIIACIIPRNLALITPTSSQSRIIRSSKLISISTSSQEHHIGEPNTDACKLLRGNVRAEQQSALLDGMNPSQVEAITQPLDAITRVIAGPGSGKTRVLTSRIAYILQNDQRSNILGVTFTRKAAGEMQQRLDKLVLSIAPAGDGTGEDPSSQRLASDSRRRVTLGTFHSICSRILRWHGDILSSLPSIEREMPELVNSTIFDGRFAIVDQSEQLRILKQCLVEKNIDLEEAKLRPFAVLSAISKAKRGFAQGEEPFVARGKEKLSKADKVAKEIYFAYRQSLLSSNKVDFDDLVYMTWELLQEHEEIRKSLQRRWPHVLVDEFQDTSQTQMDLVRFLTSGSLLVVGDSDQSIYSFRGAEVGGLADFSKHFNNVQTVFLMENYRSTAKIIEAAQKVVSSSRSGSNELRQDMKPNRENGVPPRIVECRDEKDEASFVVSDVKKKLSSGQFTAKTSVAFLYRTNAQSRALEEACVAKNLPYAIFGSATSFYKRQEVKDCLCYLQWLNNGLDRGSMLRVFKTPTKGIGDTTVQAFDEYCNKVDEYFSEFFPEKSKPTPFDVLCSFSEESRTAEPGCPDPKEHFTSRAFSHLSDFSSKLRHVYDIAQVEPVHKLLTQIIDDMQLRPHLDKISKSEAEFAERLSNVDELCQAAARYTNDGPALDKEAISQNRIVPLGSFLDDVALITDMAEEVEENAESRFVTSLMTIHTSKGMEFDTVYVVGNEEGTFPTSQAIDEGEGSTPLEEERRLCYVAMTRAKSELILSWRNKVPIFIQPGIRWVDKDRSRFLNVLSPGTTLKRESKKKAVQRDQRESKAFRRSWKSYQRKDENESSYVPIRKPQNRVGAAAVFGTGTKRRTTGMGARPPTGATYPTKPRLAKPMVAVKKPSASQVSSVRPKRPLQAKERIANTKPSEAPPVQPARPLQAYLKSAAEQAAKKSTVNLPRMKAPMTARTTQESRHHRSRSQGAPESKATTEAAMTRGRRAPISQSKVVPPSKSAPREGKSTDFPCFFPLGTKVNHKQMGDGEVVPSHSEDRTKVRVRFSCGKEASFSAIGSDLSLRF